MLIFFVLVKLIVLTFCYRYNDRMTHLFTSIYSTFMILSLKSHARSNAFKLISSFSFSTHLRCLNLNNLIFCQIFLLTGVSQLHWPTLNFNLFLKSRQYVLSYKDCFLMTLMILIIAIFIFLPLFYYLY